MSASLNVSFILAGILTGSGNSNDEFDALYSRGAYEEILSRSEQALDEDPNNPDWRIRAAHAASELGALELARDHLSLYLEKDPEDEYARTLLGRIAFSEGRYSEAKSIYQSLDTETARMEAGFVDERLDSVARAIESKSRLDRWFFGTLIGLAIGFITLMVAVLRFASKK